MTPAAPALVSFDIGGTLADPTGPTLTSLLVEASPMEPAAARTVLRDLLHTAPAITPTVVAQVCRALLIPTEAFPRTVPASRLGLRPAALPVLAAVAARLPVVTLSNVTCVDVNRTELAARLGRHVRAHHPSCDLGYAKPDPRAFAAVAARHGITMDALVHVGDHWECDVLGAVTIGATAVWLSGGRPIPGSGALPAAARVRVVADLTDVPAAIHALLERPA